MSSAHALLYPRHQGVDGHVEKGAMVAVVGHLQSEALVERVVCETGHGDPLLLLADAMGKLQRRVARAEHEYRLWHGAQSVVENLVHALSQVRERHRPVHTLLELACDDAHVRLVAPVVRIIVCQAVGLDQVDEHGSHAPRREVVVGIPVEGKSFHEPVLGLLPKVGPCDVIDAEVDAVALHEMFRLDGGEHRIRPAQGAAALVFHRRGGQHHVAIEHTRRRERLPLGREVPQHSPRHHRTA